MGDRRRIETYGHCVTSLSLVTPPPQVCHVTTLPPRSHSTSYLRSAFPVTMLVPHLCSPPFLVGIASPECRHPTCCRCEKFPFEAASNVAYVFPISCAVGDCTDGETDRRSAQRVGATYQYHLHAYGPSVKDRW